MKHYLFCFLVLPFMLGAIYGGIRYFFPAIENMGLCIGIFIGQVTVSHYVGFDKVAIRFLNER